MSNIGKIVRAVGPVVDIAFNADFLPALNTAIQIDNQGESLTVELHNILVMISYVVLQWGLLMD